MVKPESRAEKEEEEEEEMNKGIFYKGVLVINQVIFNWMTASYLDG